MPRCMTHGKHPRLTFADELDLDLYPRHADQYQAEEIEDNDGWRQR